MPNRPESKDKLNPTQIHVLIFLSCPLVIASFHISNVRTKRLQIFGKVNGNILLHTISFNETISDHIFYGFEFRISFFNLKICNEEIQH